MNKVKHWDCYITIHKTLEGYNYVITRKDNDAICEYGYGYATPLVAIDAAKSAIEFALATWALPLERNWWLALS